MTKIHDFVIIGAGISGLYTAYILTKYFNKDVVVIEKENRIGGRIYTIKYDKDLTLELGAGVISASHNNLLKLIKHLGLSDKLIHGAKKSRNYYDKETNKLISLNDSGFYKILNDINSKITDNDHHYSLYHLIEKYYDNKTAKLITDQFGYSDDILHRNAVNALEMFNKNGEFNPDNHYIFLTGGFNQIIDKLADKLNVMTGVECTNITKEDDHYICELSRVHLFQMRTKNIICAIPVQNLLRIPFFRSSYDMYNSVLVNKPLMRVYLQFQIDINKKLWFEDMDGSFITNTIIRQMIPINKKTGLIMVYVDGIDAVGLHILDNNEILESEIMLNIRKLFPDKVIDHPIKFYKKYWEIGTHLWKTNPNHQLTNKLMHPIDHENVYVVGEGVNSKHNWIEGAIMSVHDCIRKMNKCFTASQ